MDKAAAVVAAIAIHKHLQRSKRKKRLRKITHGCVFCEVLASTFPTTIIIIIIIIITIFIIFVFTAAAAAAAAVVWNFLLLFPLLLHHHSSHEYNMDLASLHWANCTAYSFLISFWYRIACQEMKSFIFFLFSFDSNWFRSENMRNDEIMCNTAHADNEKENLRQKLNK